MVFMAGSDNGCWVSWVDSLSSSKPLEIYPQPKKKPSAKKGGTTSSTSGLKKFFTTLSQSTKQRLGRFRCYSMEQICAPEPGAAVPTEELSQKDAPGTTSSPKMKKAPSLQSLRLVSSKDFSCRCHRSGPSTGSRRSCEGQWPLNFVFE